MTKLILLLTLALVGVTGLHAQTANDKTNARKTVLAFYDAFNSHNFDGLTDFTTEDWVHINPLGGWTRGRKAVLDALKQVHMTFLEGVSDTPQENAIDFRFATPDVAIVTVPSKMSPHTTPDGVRRENQGQIRTFVLVKRSGHWLIMQDQNTFQ